MSRKTEKLIQGEGGMERRILTYRKYIDELLKQDDLDWQQIRKEHLVQAMYRQYDALTQRCGFDFYRQG